MRKRIAELLENTAEELQFAEDVDDVVEILCNLLNDLSQILRRCKK